MKIIYTLFLAIVVSTFPSILVAQSSKKISESEFKAKFVGNSITDKKCTFKLKKNGNMSGKCMFTGSAATVNGKYNFGKQGFCRALTITYSAGRIREIPYKCEQLYWKGNKVKIGRSDYEILYKKAVTVNPLKKSFNKLSKSERKSIQTVLLNQGFYKSSVDGSYGKGTEKALRNYNSDVLGGADLKKPANIAILLSALRNSNNSKNNEVVKKEDKKIQADTVQNVTKSIGSEWEALAEEGSAKAQYKLALMYEKGEGFLQDFVYAHMWANLSVANGYADARSLRDKLAEKMTLSQMEKAQDLARDCMKKNFKGC